MNIKLIVILGIYVALFVLLTFIPYTGYLRFGPVAITTIPVVVALATYHVGRWGGVVAGITFGITAYLDAIVTGNLIFFRPEISFVPRVALGVLVYLVYSALGPVRLWKFVFLSCFTVVGNTVLVTAALFVVKTYDPVFAGGFLVWVTLIYVNFLVEFATAVFLSLVLFRLLTYLRSNHSPQKTRW